MTTHLAETSVLTRLSVAAVRGALQPFVDAVALARCTLTDLELGFSASSASDSDRLQAVLTTLTSVEVTPVVISRAKNVQRMLAAGGLKGRKVPDLIIAAAAELTGLTVLHYQPRLRADRVRDGPAPRMSRTTRVNRLTSEVPPTTGQFAL